MHKIYIDTEERYNKVVRLVSIQNGRELMLEEYFGDIDVVTSISKLLSKHSLSIKDINEFVPNLGPGSFTGLKVGVTIANVLNWTTGNKLSKSPLVPFYGASPNIHKKD